MYARSTTMRISPHAVDDFIALVRDDVLPTVTAQERSVGLSCLVDRETGRCITTSAWEDLEAMGGSEAAIRAARERLSETFATVPVVEEWEIAVMHRTHRAPDGAWARVTWARTDRDDVDPVIAAYRDSLMPWWDRTPGFDSNSLLVERDDGRFSSTVVFESHDAMSQTRDQFTTLREEFAQRMGVRLLETAEFEVALAHLRVPETV
jgi:quinol monooxygenase YgiN